MPKSEPLVATIDLCLSEDSQTEDLSTSVNPNMQTDQEGTTSTAHKEKPEPTDSKLNVNRKSEKKGDCKDKPRIVLTFRSEKTGAKSSNMKIVSTEEKQEEISPRRSTRLGTKGESDYECDVSIKSEKTKSQSEDDTPETTTPKRSTRWRNKDSWENVLANAIARKENYNEMPSGSVQRPSRRIKPTAKVIANQEMSESQSKLPDEGIRTRSTRSTARLSAGGSEKKVSKEPEDVEDMDVDNMPNPKLEHFTGLGLKAIKSKDIKEDSEEDVEVEDEVDTASPEGDEEEIDDDTEVINQLLEEDDTSDDDYSITEDVVEYKVRRPKRKAAQVEKEEDLPIAFRLSKRRESAREYSCRASKYSKTVSGPPTEDEEEDVGDAANGEAGVEAACPTDESKIAGACLCEAPSNVHAAPGDLPEPVFCQAIGMVDEVRVGCSHPAARDAAGELCALLRAGLRAPYFLACQQHVMQLRKHMCCPTCGLFCTQGTFYQCSGGHLFHLDCGLGNALPATAAGGGGVPGCPHCGVTAARWLPVNHAVSRVQVDMQCSNKRIFLPEQREQCTPAYLSFPTINSIAPPEGPIIPEDLIPAGFDTKLEKLLEAPAENEVDDVILEQLRDSIVAGDTDELIPKIISAKPYINQPIDASGATLAHVAAENGRLFALHALRCAGAGVDARNCSLKTPLMCAITELLESSHTESAKNKTVPKVEPVKCEESMDIDNENNSKSDAEIADDKITKAEEVKLKPSEDSVTKVPVKDDDVKEEIVKEDIVEEAKEKDADTEQKSIATVEVKSPKSESIAIVEVKSPKSEEDVSKNLVEAKTDIDDLMKTDDVPVEEQIDEPIKKIIDKTKADELLKVIRYLVNASSDIDIAGPDGLTALHLAAEFGSARVCNIILSESAADINAKDQAGWTPLAYATENHPDVIKELLSQGADASVPDNEGSTALQWAAWAGAARCLQLLAAAPSSDAPVARVPVDLDHVNIHADTALHIAARNGHYPCVAILLAHGARTDLENSNKQLALDEASGACRAAISLQMQLAIRRGDRRVRRVLASDISNGREPHPIPCINEVDDAELPTDFTYVTDHVMPEVVTVDHTLDTMKGCSCADDCSSGACECTSLSVRRWFVRGRLLPSFPHREPPMLLECNATCRCNAKRCVNSVVSNLSRSGSVFARCEVYRAGGARGWGLRTRGAVPRGAPVALYAGELLLPAAADTRAPDTYMLALDVKPDLLEECVDKRQLCVDACRYGNAARFMNHSCRPSLAVLRVLRGARDVRLPTALLVAARALPPQAALTFDYGDKFWSVKSKWISCECGELECRYNNNADE